MSPKVIASGSSVSSQKTLNVARKCGRTLKSQGTGQESAGEQGEVSVARQAISESAAPGSPASS